jgi:hypothetical protein
MTQETQRQDAGDPKIHQATPQDIAELADLMSHFNNETITSTQVAERLQHLDGVETALLARKGGEVIGLACLRVAQALFSNAPQAEVIEFYIKDGYHNGDTERLMLRGVESLARQRGASQVVLLAGLKNTDAQFTYRASGYQDYALAMRKRLPKESTTT